MVFFSLNVEIFVFTDKYHGMSLKEELPVPTVILIIGHQLDTFIFGLQ